MTRRTLSMPRVVGLLATYAVAACISATWVAGANGQSSGVPDGLNTFRILKTRNIFDPERRATRVDAPAVRAPVETGRANFIALTGTMVSAGKTLAFFTGSRPEYSKVISVGESVGDFKVSAINSADVDLLMGGKPIKVAVGRQLPLDGALIPGEPLPLAPSAPSEIVTPPPGAADSTPSAPPSIQSDVLRKMMERRQKEMSK